MRIIRVPRISIKQFNQLQSLGYVVILTQTAHSKSPYTHYTYFRTIKPIKSREPHVMIASACKCQHIK